MKKTIITKYTDAEFRQLIREEIKAVLNNEDQLIAGPESEGFMNLEQAKEFLKMKPATIYAHVHKNSIPFHKSGRRLLFKKSELQNWIAKGGKI